MQHVKVLSANLTSWGMTLISFEVLKDVLQIGALIASISVSVASVWWIRRQAQSLDRRDKEGK